MNRTIPFLAFVLLALCVYFHRETITSFPAHIHAWTQSDRYALALRFSEHPNLFLPRTYNLATRDGVTAVDLPLYDWTAGVLMRILGTGEPWIFRIWTLLLSIVGTFFLYKLAARQTQSASRGVLVALWTFTLPIVVYYQDGFLPSAAGFALLLIAYERYFSYKEAQKPAQLIQAILFFTMAALPRSPMVMFLVCVALQELFSRRFKREHLAFVPALGLIGAWALYKKQLSAAYGSQFLTQLTPAASWSEFWILTQSVCKRWLLQLLTLPHYVLLFAVMGVAVWKRFWRDAQTKIILTQVGLTLAASGAFYVFMVRQFVDHEYYFLDSFYLPLVLLFVAALKSWPDTKSKNTVLFAGLAAILVLAGAVFSKKVQEVKHREEPWDLGELTRKNFEGSGAWLDSLNIPHDAKILVIDAYTTNIPLIHLRREGWTVLTTSRENIQTALDLPFDYVILQDFSAASDVLYPYPEIADKLDRVEGNGKLTLCKRGSSSEHELMHVVGKILGYSNHFREPDNSGIWSNCFQDRSQVSTDSFTTHTTPSDEFGPTMLITKLPVGVKRVYYECSLLTPTLGTSLNIDLTLDHNGERLYYRGQSLKAKAAGEWFRFQVMFLLPEHPEGTTMKIYPWNRDKASWHFDYIRVFVQE